MRFLLFGDVALLGDDGEARPLSDIKQRILAWLLLDPSHHASTDRLLDVAWAGRPPPTGVKTLQVHVSQLRSLFRQAAHEDPPQLVSTGHGYRIELGSATSDLGQVEQLVREAIDLRSRGDLQGAARHLDSALPMFSGSPLGHLDDDPEFRPEVERLSELRMSAEDARCEIGLELGEHRRLVDWIGRLAGAEPLREGRWALWMVALYRCTRQAEALGAYQRLRSQLGESLGIEPSHRLRELEERILLQDPELDLQPVLREPELPATDGPLLGRAAEIERVADLLSAGRRLVTLHGPGGIGKTRIAIESARAIGTAETLRDIRWADLTGAVDQATTFTTITRTFTGSSTDPRDDVATLIGERAVTLVLDNCEHLVPTISEVIGRLLDRCPGLAILTTSRRPLGVSGEQRVEVPPLPVSGASGDDAVALFRQRAETAGHTVDDRDVPDIATICEALDGIPLAIELAAARLSILTVAELRDRMDDVLPVLYRTTDVGDDRHRSAEATIRWSMDLLDPIDRAGVERLAVFRGGFTLDAAESVMGSVVGLDRPLDSIGRLHDASLIVRRGSRLRMLETVRQYAEATSRSGAEHRITRQALVSWALADAPTQAAALGTDKHAKALRSLDLDRPNHIEALRVLDQESDPRLVELVRVLAPGWWWTSQIRLGNEWLKRAVDLRDADQVVLRHAALFAARAHDLTRARRLIGRLEPDTIDRAVATAYLAWADSDLEGAMAAFEHAADLQRRSHDGGLIDTLVQLARMNVGASDFETAERCADEIEIIGRATGRADAASTAEYVRAIAAMFGRRFHQAIEHLDVACAEQERLGLDRHRIGALRGRAISLAMVGDPDSALGSLHDSLRSARMLGDGVAESLSISILGLITLLRGASDNATGLFERAIRSAVRTDDRQTLSWALFGFASSAFEIGDHQHSAELLAASESRMSGWDFGRPDRLWYTDQPLSVRIEALIGTDRWLALLDDATRWDLDEIMMRAVGYSAGWVAPRR